MSTIGLGRLGYHLPLQNPGPLGHLGVLGEEPLADDTDTIVEIFEKRVLAEISHHLGSRAKELASLIRCEDLKIHLFKLVQTQMVQKGNNSAAREASMDPDEYKRALQYCIDELKSRAAVPNQSWPSDPLLEKMDLHVMEYIMGDYVDDEAYAYDSFIRDGGRPYFARDLIPYIAVEPGAYLSLTRPWLHGEPYLDVYWSVFARQYMRWMSFRTWSHTIRHSIGVNAYSDLLRKELGRIQYPLSARILPNQAQQDQDEIWVEYIAYEVWWSNIVETYVESLEAEHIRVHNNLFQSGLLNNGEPGDKRVLDTLTNHDVQDKMEAERAKARASLSLAQSRLRVGRTELYSEDREREGQARVEEAVLHLEALRRGKHLVRRYVQGTTPFFEGRDVVKYQKQLVQWAVDQVPLIRAEMRGERAPPS